MPSRRNPDSRHVRPEIVARLRQRLVKSWQKEGWNNLLLATRALHKSGRKINPIKMAEQNTRAAYIAKKYKVALQLAMRRQGIKNKAFYDEMNPLLFDLARTPQQKELSSNQQAILELMENTLTRHRIDPKSFYRELKNAVNELSE